MENSLRYTPETKLRAWVLAGLFWVVGALPALSQTSPIDLTEMSMEELLSVRLVPRDSTRTSATRQVGRSWQIGYRYLFTRFEDYYDGSDTIPVSDVLNQFPVVPTRIEQQAHIVEARYQVNDDLTLLAQLPYIKQETEHVRRMGADFTIKTEGVGDIALYALSRAAHSGPHTLYVKGGLSVPTGSIDETGDTPRGKNTQVPYTMQSGSGTFDLEPGLAYLCDHGRFQWGAETAARIRMGRNDRNYSLSDIYSAATWAKIRPMDPVLAGARLLYQDWGSIDGEDSELNATVAPVANANLYGGKRLNLLVGVQIDLGDQERPGFSFGVEGGAPLYQSLTGPQPGQEWQLSIMLSRPL